MDDGGKCESRSIDGWWNGLWMDCGWWRGRWDTLYEWMMDGWWMMQGRVSLVLMIDYGRIMDDTWWRGRWVSFMDGKVSESLHLLCRTLFLQPFWPKFFAGCQMGEIVQQGRFKLIQKSPRAGEKSNCFNLSWKLDFSSWSLFRILVGRRENSEGTPSLTSTLASR